LAAEARTIVLGLEIARTLEEATDRLAHAAMSLRAGLLQELSA
jgi:HAMP domain-containing protein